MQIKILYEENIVNGVPHYTTLDIPDGDYVTLLDEDYQMRLAEAPADKRDKVKRCATMQELYDLFNKATYNGWHKQARHTSERAAPRRLDGKRGTIRADDAELGATAKSMIECFPDNSDEEDRDRRNEYEAVCTTLRQRMKPDQAELLIAVHIDKTPKQDYAAKLGISPSALSHRLETAEKNFKKIFPESSSFTSSQPALTWRQLPPP